MLASRQTTPWYMVPGVLATARVVQAAEHEVQRASLKRDMLGLWAAAAQHCKVWSLKQELLDTLYPVLADLPVAYCKQGMLAIIYVLMLRVVYLCDHCRGSSANLGVLHPAAVSNICLVLL